MSRKIAFLFPGQGSQYLGMGQDIAESFPDVKALFEEVDEICRKPISKICFEGPIDELTLTVNLQPAITAVNLACLSALNQSGIKPVVSAGHSLGEYAALTASGVLASSDALKLAKKRGELMHRESLQNPGRMAAILGMDIDYVGDVVKDAGEKGILAVANHNTAEQIVITGEDIALSFALNLVQNNGGKAIPLKVSGAWHCDLMKNAVDEFRRFMEDIAFLKPGTVILFNATAEQEPDPVKIKDIMASQLVSPVKWYQIILKMLDLGIDTFVEVGPKKVLSGLCKKIIPPEKEVTIRNVQDMKTLNQFLEEAG